MDARRRGGGVRRAAVWVERADDPVATPDDPAVVQRGRSVFAAAGCGGCHTLGDAGATGTVGPDPTPAAPSAALVADRVRNGLARCPLSRGAQEEIDAVAAYVSAAASG